MKAFKRFLILYLIVGICLCMAKYDGHNIGEIVQIVIVGPTLLIVYAVMFTALIITQLAAGVFL